MPAYAWGLFASTVGLILLLVYVEIASRKQDRQTAETKQKTYRTRARKKVASTR